MANAEWQRGWQDGYEWAKKYYNPRTKTMPLPKGFVLRGGLYWNGFDEGARCGRSER